MPPKFISHHPRPLNFIALTLEKTNTGNLGTVIPIEKHSQQLEEKKGDPAWSPQPVCSVPGRAPTCAPHGQASARGAPDLGRLLAVTLPSHQH